MLRCRCCNISAFFFPSPSHFAPPFGSNLPFPAKQLHLQLTVVVHVAAAESVLKGESLSTVYLGNKASVTKHSTNKNDNSLTRETMISAFFIFTVLASTAMGQFQQSCQDAPGKRTVLEFAVLALLRRWRFSGKVVT